MTQNHNGGVLPGEKKKQQELDRASNDTRTFLKMLRKNSAGGAPNHKEKIMKTIPHPHL